MYKLVLTGPQNLLPKISTRVENGTLTITDNNTFNWVRDYEHRVTARVHVEPVSYTHLRAHETVLDLVCRLLLEKKKKQKKTKKKKKNTINIIRISHKRIALTHSRHDP